MRSTHRPAQPPNVPRGPVDVTVDLDNGPPLRLTAPELQAVPAGQRPAGCDGSTAPTPTTTVTSTPPTNGPTPMPVPKQEVPNIEGLLEAEARVLLENLGFTVERQAEHSDRAIDMVLHTLPTAGTPLEKGGTVLLYVSLADRFVLPDVSGLHEQEARQALEPHVSVSGDDEPAAIESGLVVRTDPPAGDSVPLDSEVRLILSSGGVVPDVTGKSPDDAYAALKKLEYVMDKNFVSVPAASPQAGVVISQLPVAGAELDQLEHVTVTIGQPSPPTTTTKPATTTTTTKP